PLRLEHSGGQQFKNVSWVYWTPEKKLKIPVSHLDSSAPAFADSIGHSSTRRVNHGHEANEAQLLSGEVHLLSVKSKALWELVVSVTKTGKYFINLEPR
uniref:Uncharacterized protein n=1 Tax=Lates calcarifer TaxID=8187 RepID=A0A4W6F2K3_LATCA